jgi:hypothetical protein
VTRANASIPSLNPPRACEVEGFRTIRRRRRWFWGLLLTYMPAGILALRSGWDLAVPLPFAWFLAAAVSGYVLYRSRCPRCSNRAFLIQWVLPRRLRFLQRLGFGRYASNSLFATRCLHCRARLYWPEQDLVDAETTTPPHQASTDH